MANTSGSTSLFFLRFSPNGYQAHGRSVPELLAHAALIEKVIKSEGEALSGDVGPLLGLRSEEEAAHIRKQGGDTLPGEVAFQLYDTFGLPPDLTADLAKESGLVQWIRWASTGRWAVKGRWLGNPGKGVNQARPTL